MKSVEQWIVEEQMLRSGDTVPVCLTIAPPERCKELATKLLSSMIKLVGALGCNITSILLTPNNKLDLLEVIDGVCDIRVVTTGTAVSFGVDNIDNVHDLRVRQFMIRAKQFVPFFSVIPSPAIRLLRAKLVAEEVLETIKALGFDHNDYKISNYDYTLDIISQVKLDCTEIHTTALSVLSSFGLPDQPFQTEVDNNNLLKFGPGHSYREDGKLIKPLTHKPPRIQLILQGITDEDYYSRN